MDGYFLTGDLGRLDTHGRLYLEGRTSLRINRAGYKMNPVEVERILTQHPLVAEAVVLAASSRYGDDRIRAIVVPRSPVTAAELIEHCRDSMADYQVPSIIEFRSALPKSSTGKVLRKALHRPKGQEQPQG